MPRIGLPDPAMFRDRACRNVPRDLFFPDSAEEATPAQAICGSCPRLVECAQWAIPEALAGRLSWSVVAGVQMPPTYGKSASPSADLRRAAATQLAEVAAAAHADFMEGAA